MAGNGFASLIGKEKTWNYLQCRYLAVLFSKSLSPVGGKDFLYSNMVSRGF